MSKDSRANDNRHHKILRNSPLDATLRKKTAFIRNRSEDTNRPSDSDLKLQHSFAKLFKIISHFAPEGDVLIGAVSTLASTCRVENASGVFAKMQSHSLNVASGPLADVLLSRDDLQFTRGDVLAKADVGLGGLALGQPGHALILHVRLSGEKSAIVIYYQPHDLGPIERDRATALQELLAIAAQAAASEDLSVDSEANALLLESIRNDNRESHLFHRRLSDSLSQCYWVTDIDSGVASHLSENFERVWGAPPKILSEGLAGFMSSVMPSDRDRVLTEFHLKLGQEFETELRAISIDGEIRWLRLRVFPFSLEGRAPGGTLTQKARDRRIILIADDITEKKSEEERVRAREAELVSKARMLAVSELAKGVAHEINNPLTIIIGKAGEIKRLLDLPRAEPKMLLDSIEKIRKTSMRIHDIVKSLNSLTHDSQNITYTYVPLGKILSEVRDMCAEKCASQGVKIEIDPQLDSVNAEINPGMISQIFLNLVENSLFAVHSEKEKWIRIDCFENDDSVFVGVTGMFQVICSFPAWDSAFSA